MVQAAEATAEQTHVMSGELAASVVVKDTRDEADQVSYVSMRRNERNHPLSANFAHMSMHPNRLRQGMS